MLSRTKEADYAGLAAKLKSFAVVKSKLNSKECGVEFVPSWAVNHRNFADTKACLHYEGYPVGCNLGTLRDRLLPRTAPGK